MARSLHFRYETATPEWRRAIQQMIKPMEPAAKEAIKQTATLARDLARKNIASAGFSQRWQKAMQFSMEKSPPDAVAAATVFHRIPFAVLFEEGGTIRGKPKLWLPIEANLPIGIKSPREYVKRFGPLVSVNRPGKPPLLFAKAPSKPKSALSPERRAKLAAVERSRGMKPPSAVVHQERKPLFVGVDSATIHKRFAIYNAIKAAVDHLGEFYMLALAKEDQKNDGKRN